MTEPPQPAPRPASQLNTPPQGPAIADALRALGPDYEEALVNSIAARVDELAQQREARHHEIAPAPRAQEVPAPPRPPQLPVAPPPAPYAPPPAEPHRRRGGGVALPVSILTLVFGFVITVVALTAGFSNGGPLALVAILIVWAALVLINIAAWHQRP